MTDEPATRCPDENGALGDDLNDVIRCVKDAGHKGAHAWHHDAPTREHTTVVWWTEPARRAR